MQHNLGQRNPMGKGKENQIKFIAIVVLLLFFIVFVFSQSCAPFVTLDSNSYEFDVDMWSEQQETLITIYVLNKGLDLHDVTLRLQVQSWNSDLQQAVPVDMYKEYGDITNGVTAMFSFEIPSDSYDFFATIQSAEGQYSQTLT